MPIATRVQAAAGRLRREAGALRFEKPVTHVYNPLEYAARPHATYLRRFAGGTKRVLFLGMNPGPFGMAQTGVPFGEVEAVRDWLDIRGPVKRPGNEHPKRPVLGFGCPRSEISGARLWGAIAARWREPQRFFADHFVANYCPLMFLEESGRNRTPDRLRAGERERLFAVCDRHLRRLAEILEPEWVVGIGSFATARAGAALGGTGLRIGSILHPSPANPRANRGWARQAETQLRRLGLCEAGCSQARAPGRKRRLRG